MIFIFSFPFLFLFSLLTPFLSGADEYHLRDLLVGERAAGLGGAFIAISDDPSGIFYNPAGILFSFENYFSLSANAYASVVETYKNVIDGKDYVYTSNGLIPSFFGLIQNYKKSKIGFAIIVPRSDLYDQDDDIEITNVNPGGANTFKRKFFRSNSTMLLGPAFATELSKDLSGGISLLASYHVDKFIDNQSVLFKADGSGKERFYFQQVSFSQTDYGLLPKIGFQYMPLPKWSLGFTLSKAIPLNGSATRKEISSAIDSNSGSPLDINYTLSHDLYLGRSANDTRGYSPTEIGIGIGYFPSKRWVLTGDGIYSIKDPDFKDFSTVDTFNASLGMEYYPTEVYALRLGLFTNQAITPKLTSGATNQPPHVDLYGLGLGFASVSQGSSFTIGVNYSSGSGYGQPFGGQMTLNEVTQKGTVVFLTGSYQI